MNKSVDCPTAQIRDQPWLPRVRAVAAILALATFVVGSAMAGPPIRGVGLVVKKNPGGSAERITTGANGEFTITNLRTGRYTLEVVPAAPLRPGQPLYLEVQSSPASRAPSGGELHKLQLTLKPGQARAVQVEITRDGGQITGTVPGDDTRLQGTSPVTKGGATI